MDWRREGAFFDGQAVLRLAACGLREEGTSDKRQARPAPVHAGPSARHSTHSFPRRSSISLCSLQYSTAQYRTLHAVARPHFRDKLRPRTPRLGAVSVHAEPSAPYVTYFSRIRCFYYNTLHTTPYHSVPLPAGPPCPMYTLTPAVLHPW